MYIGHLNTVVSISLVSGAKESASAPMAAIYLLTTDQLASWSS